MHPSVTQLPYGEKRFGRYKPLAVLGRGGMANVYLAVSSGPGNFNKLAVIKELKPELVSDPEFVSMFVDEARLAARLQHPNVVHTYEVIEGAGEHAFVMEYLDGQPMNRVRMRLSDTSPTLAMGAQLRIVAEALAGLHYAHELCDYDGSPLCIVHRDVSPHNIFISYSGQVKVVDFGIAKTSDSSAQTQVGVIKGKLSYMAPEQALGEPVDRRADIFAMGLVLWEAASGQRIWQGMHDGAILNLLSTGKLPQLQVIAPSAPAELTRICARALAAHADDRYATAAEFLADLEGFMRGMPTCPAARELGELISQAFEGERKGIRELIDEQMRALKPGTTGEFPPGHLAEFPQRPSSMQPDPLALTRDSAAVTEISNVGLIQPHPSPSVSPPAVVELSASPLSSPSAVSQLTMATTPTASPPLRVAAIAAGAVLLVCVTLGGAFLAFRRPASAAQAPTTSAPTTPPLSAQSPTPVTNVRLRINIVPRGAHATLDGQTVLTPGPTLLAADNKPHALEIDAPGYERRSLEISLDSDKELDVTLDKSPAPPSAPVTVTRPPRPPTTKPAASAGEPDLGY